jgi:Fur family transcriptional regulator, ferric uptake regulator
MLLRMADGYSEGRRILIERAQAEIEAWQNAAQQGAAQQGAPLQGAAPGRESEPDAQVQAWADRARVVARRAGHRRGRARDVLIELFAEEECALSVPEIEQRLADGLLSGRNTPVGIASIYRAVELLQDLKLLTRIEVGDGVARYERAYVDRGNHDEHHHHMVCERCGLLIAFDDPELERAIDSLSKRLGFAATGHEVTLRGTCLECQ